jgi:RsfA family transcription factor
MYLQKLNAFEEAATRLGRTSSACGFRFNSVVRKKYQEEIKAEKSKKGKMLSCIVLPVKLNECRRSSSASM